MNNVAYNLFSTKMERYEIDRLREMPVESVLSRLGINVVRGWGLCPHHADRKPSLHVDRRRNLVKCFACGYGPADTIGITQEVLGVGFREATRWLAQEYGVIIDESRKTHADTPVKPQRTHEIDREWMESLLKQPVLCEEARQFLEERKIDMRVVSWLGLTSITSPTPSWRYGRPFFHAPSLLIPYRDVEGRLITVQGRTLTQASSIPRFQFPRGGKPTIYNLPILKWVCQDDELWIAEGPSDCWAMLSDGHKAVAIPSATLLNEADIKVLNEALPERCCLVACPDHDEAGERLFHELVRMANDLRRPIRRFDLPEGIKDYGEWHKRKSGVS